MDHKVELVELLGNYSEIVGVENDDFNTEILVAGYEDVIVPEAPVWLGWGAAVDIASFLLAISTIGLHLWLRPSYGRLGRIGMGISGIAFASFGIMGFIATGLLAIGVDPEMYRLGGVVVARVFGSTGMLGMPIGMLMLGIALWRRDLISKSVATLLILTFPGQFVHIVTVDMFVQLTGRRWGILLFVIPFGLGWMGLCYYFWRRTTNEEYKKAGIGERENTDLQSDLN